MASWEYFVNKVHEAYDSPNEHALYLFDKNAPSDYLFPAFIKVQHVPSFQDIQTRMQKKMNCESLENLDQKTQDLLWKEFEQEILQCVPDLKHNVQAFII